jgi:hypothetical protein
MMTQRQSAPIIRGLFVLVPGFLGWLLYCAAAWIARHDSINSKLYSAGFGFVSVAAAIVFALGPVPPIIAGLVLGLPSVVGCFCQARSLFRLAALNALAVVTLLLALGSAKPLLMIGLYGVTAVLWILAAILAATRPSEPDQPDASDNSGQAPQG